MKKRQLIGSNATFAEPNIYGDKSSLILEWLLLKGIQKKQFSIREIANETGVSLGQVQKVISVLTMNGHLVSEGVRTAKKFVLNKPKIILKEWLEHYNITKKCKMFTYSAGIQGNKRLLDTLKKTNLTNTVTLALHSSADALGFKNTNLATLELYVPNSTVRGQIEEILQLEPQERGYEVLLIEPYYKSMINHSQNQQTEHIRNSPPLLTFLDLYHFPLRGQEQAEFMAERMTELKRIYK